MDPRKGKHIKVKFIGSREALGSPKKVHLFLADLVEKIGMRALASPICYSVPIQVEKLGMECEEDEGGVTGVVVLSTSHAALHSWPEHHYCVLDVYSCRTFETRTVRNLICKYFTASDLNIHINDLSHSLDFPYGLPSPTGSKR